MAGLDYVATCFFWGGFGGLFGFAGFWVWLGGLWLGDGKEGFGFVGLGGGLLFGVAGVLMVVFGLRLVELEL
ncbi:hypothetical protein [Helicobacter sp. 11S02629-2]|uniref:hypothetical protein n=1 Tax=Helicobacter sp. 11S02629-2 TaxID=1476195 RepID=UPI001179A7E7|nr:hypothetical protein [Helicobacter sp. 11S02629-2]